MSYLFCWDKYKNYLSNIPKMHLLSLNTVKNHYSFVPASKIIRGTQDAIPLHRTINGKGLMKTRVAALGDSVTKGVVLTDRNRYAVLDNNFMDIVARELDLHIDNYGKFGCTVNFGGKVIDRHTEDIAKSDYTFIEYGGNDCDFDWLKIAQTPEDPHSPKTSLQAFKRQIGQLVERVRNLGSRPVLVSLPPILSEIYFSFFSKGMSEEQKANIIKWLGGDTGIISRWHESYNRAIFDVARRTQTPVIDITTPFDTYRGKLDSLFCPDGIHPNAAGHKLIAATIVNMYF